MAKYVITISKILYGFPFVSNAYVYDEAMYANEAFLELCDIYMCEIEQYSDDEFLAHAVGKYQGEKIAINMITVYDDQEV